MWFKNNLIHPFNRYLLNVYYIPGTIPGARIIYCYSCWNCRQITVNEWINEEGAWILESPWMRWGQKVRYNNPKPRWQHRHFKEVKVWMLSSLEMSSISTILIRGRGLFTSNTPSYSDISIKNAFPILGKNADTWQNPWAPGTSKSLKEIYKH